VAIIPRTVGQRYLKAEFIDPECGNVSVSNSCTTEQKNQQFSYNITNQRRFSAFGGLRRIEPDLQDIGYM
jgi:hypothetical protein